MTWPILRFGRSQAPTGVSQDAPEGRGRTVQQLPVPSYRAVVERGTAAISYVTPELEEFLGYSRADFVGDRDLWATIVHEEDRERVVAERRHHLESGERLRSEYRLRDRRGGMHWVRDEAVVARPRDSTCSFQHGVLIDITERKVAEEALAHRALHDALTELPNRGLLLDRLEQTIFSARRTGGSSALLLLDLDRFKDVNDTFGHRYGDDVLRSVVAALRDALRESDTVARLGGDEFAVLLPAVDTHGASLAAQKLLTVLRRPFEAEGQVLDVGAAVGIALYPDHGEDPHTLLRRAEVAMYSAKRTEAGFAVYQPDRDPHTPAHFSLRRELRVALEEGQFVLHYQPKAQLRTGSAGHMEALLRWHHPERELLMPEVFLAAAENAGLIKPLTLWVLDAALRQCHEWLAAGRDISVAVNLSPRTLHDPDLVDTIAGLLATWKVPASYLEVEITEGALMDDPGSAMQTLSRLHALGICISIDDFGTGYSSLSYLTRLPADQIKIDKSFVQDMVTNGDSAFIVRSVIELGHNLSMEVVAEGVEDQRTWDLLTEMGCDVAQGYHVSRPLPAADVARWLDTARSRLVYVS